MPILRYFSSNLPRKYRSGPKHRNIKTSSLLGSPNRTNFSAILGFHPHTPNNLMNYTERKISKIHMHALHDILSNRPFQRHDLAFTLNRLQLKILLKYPPLTLQPDHLKNNLRMNNKTFIKLYPLKI